MPLLQIVSPLLESAGPKQAGVGFYPAVFDNRISFLRSNA